jgi:hypothetical protein
MQGRDIWAFSGGQKPSDQMEVFIRCYLRPYMCIELGSISGEEGVIPKLVGWGGVSVKIKNLFLLHFLVTCMHVNID